jgi:hypothetical protein
MGRLICRRQVLILLARPIYEASFAAQRPTTPPQAVSSEPTGSLINSQTRHKLLKYEENLMRKAIQNWNCLKAKDICLFMVPGRGNQKGTELIEIPRNL